MQIPLKWINELVNVDSINLDDLIEKLTLGGFEVEEIIELEIDGQHQLALDISATANRSDNLSIQGMATEIAALLNKSTTISTYSSKTSAWKQQLDDHIVRISNQDNSNCSTLLAIIIENLSDFTVPKWIKQKLISSNITPVNNLLDFQNYILLETGYPVALYDFNKISSKLNSSNFKLGISKAENNQEFTAVNDITYKLNSSNLILKSK
jgi:phenylalanyl-tRNA synthetase beta chain